MQNQPKTAHPPHLPARPPPPREVYRYIDTRGDTIIFKFDASLLGHPTESPILIFHEWRQELWNKIQLYSTLVDTQEAIERFKKDGKPTAGFLLHEERDEQGRKVTYRWVGFEKSERGYVRSVDGEVLRSGEGEPMNKTTRKVMASFAAKKKGGIIW